MIPVALIGVIVAAVFVVCFKRKYGDGPVTYPIWSGNLLIPWAAFLLLFAALAGAFTLPKLVGILWRTGTVSAVMTEVGASHKCDVTYSYTVAAAHYTGSDSWCGLKAGDERTIYYDSAAPEHSTLYPPAYALQSALMAIGLISAGLATLFVVWFLSIHVIGRRKAP